MIGLGRQTIGTINDFSQVLLPAAAVLTAATGQVSAAAARQGATVLFARLLLQVIDQLLIPFVYAYVACVCAYASVGNEGLKKLSSMLKGGITGVLTTIMLVFVAYLTVTGAVAGSVDAAAVKAARMAISRAVPVVGGVLSDAAETVLAGAGVLRGSVGVVGLLVVLSVCVGPFLHLAVHYLTYKLTAALSGTVAEPRLSGLLDSIGGAFGLVLGMTGACALLLLISLVAAVSAVTG
jgi:stage III sporulation protein AE